MTGYLPGDILLVDDWSGATDWLGGLIRAGERARGDRDAVWTHSALIINADGDIVEALAEGVRRTNVSKYAHVQTKVIRLPVTPKDPRRAYAVRFALAQVGDPYGKWDFVSLAFSTLFDDRWSSHKDGQPICSELVARATESATEAGYPFVSERMMPSDLERTLENVPPLPRLSFFQRLGLLLSVTAKALLGLL